MRRVGALAGLAALLLARGSALAGSPQVDYMLECQGCHLADGSGSAGAVPDMRNSLGRFLLVPGGRAYLVRVPGSATSPLSDAALAQVLNWMIGRFGPDSVARSFEPYSEAEVGQHRTQPLVEVEALRAELLRALDAKASGGEPAGVY